VADLGFVHEFEPPLDAAQPILLLLHGTGGDERTMLPLGREIAPNAGRLSPLGKVSENGMPRFFRRLAEGVFDLEDLQARTVELAAFVDAAAASYRFNPRRVVALGYSNGANIAASLLLIRPGTLAGAVLFRAMVPLVPDPLPALARTPVLLSNGRLDPLISPAETERLEALLRQANADVMLAWQRAGHALATADVSCAREWLSSAHFAA
jgi:predicted esterase